LLPEKSVKMGLIGHRKVGVELDKEKLWHVTSNTKMVTATMILQLMEEGKLSLEDPISKFGISYDKIDESYKIKHLLGHNTNYGNYTESGTAIWPEIYGNPSKVYDLDFLLKNYLPNSNSNPTTGYMYNNTNYAILGMIVEGLTGKDLATAAKERIFDPLGLTKTSLRTEGMDVKELNGVYRYFGNDLQDLNSTPVMSYLSMWGGAGAMVTTTDEFAVLVKNLLSSKFLKQETIDLATTSSPGSTKTFGDYTISYGLGFSLTEYKGFSSYGHGGNGLHKSVSLHDSENNITITFAYNHMADHDDTKRAELGTALYELALKEIGKL
ncbi:MAG: serine hydrolase domain-containing protein, partial [Bacteroidia bacterium]